MGGHAIVAIVVVSIVAVVVVVVHHGGSAHALHHTPRHAVGGAIGWPHVAAHIVHRGPILVGVIPHGSIHVWLRCNQN